MSRAKKKGSLKMKIKTLSMLAGVSAPLIATASAPAGFLGITSVVKGNTGDLIVVNVYANFDRPGEDFMQAVAGTELAPMLIQVIGGTFYNHALGTDRAPLTSLVATYPSLAFDSFVTIGVKAVGDKGQPFDLMTITPDFPVGITGTSLSTTLSGWAITPGSGADDPFNPDYFAGDGRVLIGQFSTADGFAIGGTFLIQYVSNGRFESSVVSFFAVPTPGALALLGVAGLIGTRRRR